MAIVDDRGRLFGRVNLIDFAVLMFLVILLPLGYAAYRLLRVPEPRVLALEPSSLVVQRDGDQRVKVKGENLRPFLKANLNAIAARNLLVESPTSGELILTGLPVGVYDLLLSDDSQVVARTPRALTITPVPAPPVQLVGHFSGPVRAGAPLAVGSTVKVGDRSAELLRIGPPGDARAATLRLSCEVVQGQCAIGSTQVAVGKTLTVNGPGSEVFEFRVDELRIDAVWTEVTVRFYGIPEVISAMKPGDIDRYLDVPLPDGVSDVRRGAFILTLDAPQTDQGRVEFNFTQALSPGEATTRASTMASLPIQKRSAVLLVPFQGSSDKTPGAPKYRDSVVRPGGLLSFETSAYAVRGLILRTGSNPATPEGRP